MDYSITRTVDPASPAVGLAAAKRHCNVVATDDDDLVTRLVTAATEMVEQDSNRSLITQTWRLRFAADSKLFACRRIELPRPPLASVSSIQYVDSDGNTQAFAASNYHVDTDQEPGGIWLAKNSDWPTDVAEERPDGVTVLYTAGYGSSASSVPERARQAILLLVGHWYLAREAIGEVGDEIELAYQSLINRLKPGNYVGG